MDESAQTPDPRDPVGETPTTEYARPEGRARRPWVIAAVVGVIVLIVGAIFGVKALAGGGSSSSASTASQGQAQGNRGRRGTIGMLQSIDGSTLTVTTFNRGGGNNTQTGNNTNGGGAGAAGGTTTVTTNGSTKFYKSVSGALSDVKVGDRVTAMGTPAGDNAVTAERITDTGTMNAGFGGPGGGDGGGRRFRNGNNTQTGNTPNGAPPSSVPNGGTRPDPNSFAAGTVKSISGTTLTVADNQGATKTVNTTSSTAVSVLKSVGINDLSTGQIVIVQGAMNSDGTVSATNVVQGVGGGGGFGRFRGGPGGSDGNGGGNDNGQPPGSGATSQ